MGRKKTQKGSPSKSEPGSKSVNLLRAALTKSRSDRTIVPPVPSGSSMVDITNVPQRPNLSTLSSTRSVIYLRFLNKSIFSSFNDS